MPAVTEKLSNEVQTILSKRIEENQLTLPLPPSLVMKTMGLLKNPNFSPKDAAPLVERDSVLALKVLRQANSVEHGGMEPVKNLPLALTRLGAERLRTLLVEVSAHRLFESRDPKIAEATNGLWEHSLAVAILARDLATHSKVEDVEGAYLAGLLHDIGKPVVAILLLETEKSVIGTRTNQWIGPDVWINVINRIHRPVGVALAQKWGLPDTVLAGIQDCTEYNSNDRLSVANCVRFANAVAKSEKLYVGEVDKADIDTLMMIGKQLLSVDDETLTKFTSGLGERVKGLMA